jgi:hypothetical protein
VVSAPIDRLCRAAGLALRSALQGCPALDLLDSTPPTPHPPPPRGIMSWSLTLMIEEHQIAHLTILSYPFMPSFSQVFAAYMVEVLGHKPRV